ncbi:hypothetical protein cgp_1470 [Corynebacterium glutamicum MB001]|nr:hypothetical protein cgp_1470 [Corynebacterium glutamicum MB001]ASW13934.1 hypothetical protein cgc1_1470 [Corynebacterium glutamicum]QYO73527.1 hypothetical protein cgisf_1470 [Corynebacterium glutamicum]
MALNFAERPANQKTSHAEVSVFVISRRDNDN